MAKYLIWYGSWTQKKPEFDNAEDALRKAYAMSKLPKYKDGFIHIAKAVGNNVNTHWRLVGYMDMANKKKEVVIMDNNFMKSRILKSNGEVGEIVRNRSIIRDGRKVGDMLYVGKLPEKGWFYNYETRKMDTYTRKR